MNIRTIAKKSGVSTATVSRVLNNSAVVNAITREKVLSIAKTNNFQPRISRQKTFTIGISIPDLANRQLDHSYVCEFIAGVARAVSKVGFSIQIIDSNDFLSVPQKTGAFNDYAKEKGINAFVHTLAPLALHSCFDRIAEDGISQVILEHRFERSDVCWIDVDNLETSAHLAVTLARLKATKFAIVTAERKFKGHADRYEGFVKGLQSLNISIPQVWDIQRREASIEAGTTATLSLLTSSHEIPRVIYYTNSELALGGIKTLLSRGLKLPQDVVVAMFDDSNYGTWSPTPVAYLRLPAYDIGLKAGLFFVGNIAQHNDHEILVPELFIGPDIVESLENNP